MTDAEQEFIQGIRDAVEYWQREDRADRKAALRGLAHSILCFMDGVTGEDFCYDLIRKGESDPEEGEPEPDVVISSMFHELLYDGWRS